MNDPDNAPEQLVFNVLEVPSGHFEYSDKVDAPITSFTQEDLINRRITFVHHKNSLNESYVSLQLSDGIETSVVTKLRVTTFPQYWRLQNNTGLVLVHRTSATITPYNLSFVSNIGSGDDSAQFQITQAPQFGVIEVEKENGVWKSSTIFSNGELKQHRVRYRHTTARPDFDEFQVYYTYDIFNSYRYNHFILKIR